jgi:two-component system, chemotaxis family, chemotaxis protein CheY
MPTCLIVDESNVIRKVATRIIFQLEFTVANAASGAEALELLDTGELPDIVIVAAGLNDMQPDAFVKRVRALPNGSQPVILASMVEANLGMMTRLKRAGCSGFIYKPFNRKTLTEWLRPYVGAAA